MVDEAYVLARKAGREAADNLTELYIEASATLKKEHGLEASLAFLDTLRDNLISIRPLKEKESEVAPEVKPETVGARGWDERNIPERYTLVTFDDEVLNETDKAVLIGETWVPKSQLLEVPDVGEYIEEWPVTEWFAEKEGLA